MKQQQQATRKLGLKKKTISKLGQASMNHAGGESTTIYQYTAGCMTDFTRVTITSWSIMTSH